MAHTNLLSMPRRLRVAVVLRGAVVTNPKFATKYRGLLDALAATGLDVEPYDASLGLPMRLVDAALAFRANPARWRRSLRNNPFAFARRSSSIARRLVASSNPPDVVLQLGGVFDSRWDERVAPSVIYTDYTACLAAQRPAARRTPAGLDRWVELERRAYARADAICVRSRMVHDSLVTQYGVDPRRVHVVGGGANVDDLPPLPLRSAPIPPTALFVGRDFTRKGGDLVLEAFARVRRTIPEARLLFATRRPIPSHFPTDGVVAVSSTWDRERMLRLYTESHLFVLPARLETWGDVLLEAMAHGLPCIGVRGEPMQEIIRHRTDGVLVAPGDVEDLASWMERLLADTDLCRRWGVSARQRVGRDFLWRHVAERMLPVLDTAAGRR